jgi:hypothetical protein
LETRVGIRFFVAEVSVLLQSLFQFVYDLTVCRTWLRHQSTQNLMRKTVMLSDGRRIGNSCRNPFFGDKVIVLFLFCRCHFLHFVYDLTVSLAWLRHHSTLNSMRKSVMLSDWRSSRNSSRNPFFCDNGKCFVAFWCHHFFQFVCLLINSTACLMHQSMQNRIKIAGKA